MDNQICSDIKTSVSALFADRVKIHARGSHCVVTMPFQTVDERRVSLIVEPGIGDSIFVHDGGKTDSELYCQGVDLSPAKLLRLKAVAQHYGVSIGQNRDIGKLCHRTTLNAALLDVAQCAVLTSQEIVGHKVVIEDETISRRVRSVLKEWKPDFVSAVGRNQLVRGETAVHNFPYVIYAAAIKNQPVAVKILHPTHAQWQAERFGFLVYDIRQSLQYSNWSRLTVLSKIDEWPSRSINLVRNLSDAVVGVEAGAEDKLATLLPEAVTQLMKKAA